MSTKIDNYLAKDDYYPSIDSYIEDSIDANPNIDKIKNIRVNYKTAITNNFIDNASEMMINNMLFVHVNSGRSTIKVAFINNDVGEVAKKKIKELSYDCIMELPYDIDFSGYKQKETQIVTDVYNKSSNILMKDTKSGRSTNMNQYIRSLKYSEDRVDVTEEENSKEIYYAVMSMSIA